ncbi:MAG: hypothetical protein M2R45_02687 [Verrucomicrobia subdivision 3 bacterium]|nr:hypothetical protein [Limisphaerales bacterium]MCS1415029.1 hypothetical protein [Limisphaerales bacterium]
MFLPKIMPQKLGGGSSNLTRVDSPVMRPLALFAHVWTHHGQPSAPPHTVQFVIIDAAVKWCSPASMISRDQ